MYMCICASVCSIIYVFVSMRWFLENFARYTILPVRLHMRQRAYVPAYSCNCMSTCPTPCSVIRSCRLAVPLLLKDLLE